MISAMIRCGSSERGLSEVTNTTSASRAAISPISGRLPRSRSPPAPNTHSTRPRRPAAARAAAREHVLERVGRVRVVDEHREVLARDRPARSGPGRARPAPAPRPARRDRPPRLCTAASAPSALATLKRPGIGSDDLALARRGAQREAAAVEVAAQLARAVVGGARRSRTCARRRAPPPDARRRGRRR